MITARNKLQLTFAILKPDLMQRPFAAKVVQNIIVREGFYIVRSTLTHWKVEDARQFYAEHKGKLFFHRLVTYMTSGPINPLVLAHPDAVSAWRTLMGPTKSYVACTAAPLSIRGTFGISDTRNSVHGADSIISATREMGLLFQDFDPVEWFANEEAGFRSGVMHYNKQTNQHELLYASKINQGKG